MNVKRKQIVSMFLVIYFLAMVSAPVFAEEIITEYRALDPEAEPNEEELEEETDVEEAEHAEEDANGEEEGNGHGGEDLEPVYGPVYAIVGGVAFLGILTLVYLIFG